MGISVCDPHVLAYIPPDTLDKTLKPTMSLSQVSNEFKMRLEKQQRLQLCEMKINRATWMTVMVSSVMCLAVNGPNKLNSTNKNQKNGRLTTRYTSHQIHSWQITVYRRSTSQYVKLITAWITLRKTNIQTNYIYLLTKEKYMRCRLRCPQSRRQLQPWNWVRMARLAL